MPVERSLKSQYAVNFVIEPVDDGLRCHSAKSSEFLARVVGSERLMFGTDFPFDMGSTSPVAEIEGNSVLTTGERARVFNGSAVEFLRLGEQVH